MKEYLKKITCVWNGASQRCDWEMFSIRDHKCEGRQEGKCCATK